MLERTQPRFRRTGVRIACGVLTVLGVVAFVWRTFELLAPMRWPSLAEMAGLLLLAFGTYTFGRYAYVGHG